MGQPTLTNVYESLIFIEPASLEIMRGKCNTIQDFFESHVLTMGRIVLGQIERPQT